MPRLTRRRLLGCFLAPWLRALGQESLGMASRGVKPARRGKPSGLPFKSQLTDVAHQAGLHAVTIAGHPDRVDYIIETMSCGAAFFDYDNDGWLDIFLLNGSRFGDPPADASNRLYRNNRDGTFTDVTRETGLWRTGYAYGVTVGDYNNDGYEDLFITYWGDNVLYRNNGDGTFTDVTREAGLTSIRPRWGSGCAFLDYDRDGRLDLFVANYVNFDIRTVPRPDEAGACKYYGVPVNCGPRGLPYGYHSLYRNNGDGTFTDVTAVSGIAQTPGGYGLTAAAADFDGDGWTDIYVACDSTPSLLFVNNGDGTFREEGLERGVALSDDGMLQAGMGVAVGDLDLDGSLDILKMHFREDTPVLYLNDGRGNFRDATLQSGLAVETRFVSWGTGLVDLDNDGLPDVFWVTGNIYPEVERRLPDIPHRTPRVLFRNLGRARLEQLLDGVGPGVEARHASRGCAFGDFDNDGDLDVLIVNQNEPPSLLRNDVDAGHHWLKIKLVGIDSNRSAIGAVVRVRYGSAVQAQAVLSQSSYLSVNDSRLHFGLGTARLADIEVRWPSGRLERYDGVEADRLVYITEGVGITRRETFGK